MNTQSVDCRRITTLPLPEGAITEPGDFGWDTDSPNTTDPEKMAETRYLYLHLPGETRWGALCVRRGAPGGDRVWGWDGNEDKPTLTPSIYHVGVWHGYLRAGRLISC